ncbi:MAG: TolC family protein [Planctomycetales bacterium]|nr:TolC family protein [Planctomycetales bacterium]NIN09719.1 TolC family protein [Planctomycetales bacterium]NIP05897.1 TolC family protein [Planctomycetales bacterium]NIP71411.1 TolC family protein [Planctomycetales bacterium]
MLTLTWLLTGCHPTQPFYFGGDSDLSHFVNRATEIDYPDVEVSSLPDTKFTDQPLTLDNADFENFWELSLNEAVKVALTNSKVLRNLGGRVDLQTDQLLRNPDAAQTIYNPALQETGTGINQPVGPEAALAAFDADFTTSVLWQKNDDPNNVGTISLGRRLANVQDLGTFQAALTKTAATGATFAVRNTTTYDQNNTDTQFRPFPSEWRTNFETEIRQPLLQGAGTRYNRIAGPFNPLTGVGTRAFDGVVLARINTDRTLADFEAGVRELLRDLESTYWELFFAYHNLAARKDGLDAAQKVWYNVSARVENSVGVQDEARAREQYFFFRAAVEASKSQLLGVESRLRYLMGLSASDGRLIRPSDEPLAAKVSFEWHEVLGESLGRNVDLRKQKWRIKQRELELVAAKNHLLPRLDAVGQYRWLGFGDRLIDPGSSFQSSPNLSDEANRFRSRFDNAFGNLMDGDFQEWQIGLQGSIPLGFRRELAGVKNAEFQLARDKAILREQELELSHVLAEAVRRISEQFQLMETQFNRRRSAKAQVDAINELIRGDVVGTNLPRYVDLLLDAERRLSDAEVEYYRALVDYNRSIVQLHYQKGSLLEYNQVFLAEGPWPAKAYFDAIRLARQRDASLFLDYGLTRPKTISRGPYLQLTRDPHTQPTVAAEQDEVKQQIQAEELPAPAPEQSPWPEPSDEQDGAKMTQALPPDDPPAANPWASEPSRHAPSILRNGSATRGIDSARRATSPRGEAVTSQAASTGRWRRNVDTASPTPPRSTSTPESSRFRR